MLRRGTILLLALCALCAAPAGAAAQIIVDEGKQKAKVIVRPSAFAVSGTNGYRVYVQPRINKVDVTAYKNGQWITYTAPAKLTQTSLRASFGKLGRVAMDFDPTGKLFSKRPPGCDSNVTMPSGTFEGRFRFRGEGGFFRARARTPKASVSAPDPETCAEDLAEVPGPAAALEVLQRFEDRSLVYASVFKTGPSSASYFASTLTQKRGRVGIERTVAALGPSGSFTYSATGTTADGQIQAPPLPFQGSAVYHHEFPGTGAFAISWTGSFGVTFPGGPVVPLTGAGYESGLTVGP